jgi:GH15 family glucan-1,4-alpha-glucosidase
MVLTKFAGPTDPRMLHTLDRIQEELATDEALGNYPQAFTHLSLITACYHVDQALNASKAQG